MSIIISFSPSLLDHTFCNWAGLGIKIWRYLYVYSTFALFLHLATKFSLPEEAVTQCHMFKTNDDLWGAEVNYHQASKILRECVNADQIVIVQHQNDLIDLALHLFCIPDSVGSRGETEWDLGSDCMVWIAWPA